MICTVTLPDFKEKNFKTADAAREFLAGKGFTLMAKRTVKVHGYKEEFYGQSATKYDRGQYATINIPLRSTRAMRAWQKVRERELNRLVQCAGCRSLNLYSPRPPRPQRGAGATGKRGGR